MHARARTIDALIAAQDRATVPVPVRTYVVRMFSRYGEPMGEWSVPAPDAEQAMRSTAGEMLAAYGAGVFPLILVVGAEMWLATVTVENAGHRVEHPLDFRPWHGA